MDNRCIRKKQKMQGRKEKERKGKDNLIANETNRV